MSLGKTTDNKPTFYEKTNKNISCSDHGQCLLLLDCPMGDRTQYPWIESGVPCKPLLSLHSLIFLHWHDDNGHGTDTGDWFLSPWWSDPSL
jgi:hypothetical protein